jgi:hypothetical protein
VVTHKKTPTQERDVLIVHGGGLVHDNARRSDWTMIRMQNSF